MPNTTIYTNNQYYQDIAAAIRSKNGQSILYKPSEMAAAITALDGGGNSSGGGNPYDSVVFYDYDGCIVASYSKAEFTAMPENPSHEGLTAQGWNWTKAQIDSYLTDYPEATVNVGQMYTTNDGKTRLYVHFEKGKTSPYLVLGVNGTVTIDWGDGSSTDTLTGKSLTTSKNVQHVYQPGDYVIKLTPTSGEFTFLGNNTVSRILLENPNVSNLNARVYSSAIQKIELGSSFVFDSTYAFSYCYSLVSITIPNGLTTLPDGTFYECRSLKSVTIPSGITTINNYSFYDCYSLFSVILPSSLTNIAESIFQNCYSLSLITIPNGVISIGARTFYPCNSLSSLTIPNSVTSIGDNIFQYCGSLSSVVLSDRITNIPISSFHTCSALRSVVIPNSVTTIGNNVFMSCYCLASITIPSNVTAIGDNAFSGCYGMAEYHFLSTTPPTLGSNAFKNISSDCIIYVPMASVEAYKTANNWSDYASQIQGE